MANGLDYTADFKDKFSNNAITPQSVPIVQSVVVDVNTTINGNDVKVVAIVEISVEIIKTQEVNALTGVTGDNVFLDMAQLKVSNFVGMLNDKFDSTYDIEIKDNVEKVLEVSCSPFIESVTPLKNMLKLWAEQTLTFVM